MFKTRVNDMKTCSVISILVMLSHGLFAQFEITVTPQLVEVKTSGESVQLERNIQILLKEKLPPKVTMTVEVESGANTLAKWGVTITDGTWKTDTLIRQNVATLRAPTNQEPPIFLLFLNKDKNLTSIKISFTDQAGNGIDTRKNNVASGSFLTVPVTQPNDSPQPNKVTAATRGCLIKSDTVYYFIPAFYRNRFEPGNACIDCLNDYNVVYDIGNSTICYFKREECDCSKQPTDGRPSSPPAGCSCQAGRQYCYVGKERIRPKVGANVGFHLFGYSPTYDSVSSTFAFESKNLELRDQFQQATTPPTQKKEETVPEQKGNDAANQPGLGEVKTFFAKMKNEFIEYFSYLLSSSPNNQLVQADIDYVNGQLNNYCLSVVEFSSRGLTIAAQSYINNTFVIKNKDEQKQKDDILAIIHQAALYYGFILNYHAINVPVVQVKNEDQFQWTVNFYKKKTVIDTRLYTMMISGGWKIDFSSGFVFNNLNDNEYAIQYDMADITPDDPTNVPVEAAKIIKQDKGNYKVDIGLMAHIYPRTGRRTNVGFNTGVVLRNGTTVKYLLGGSIMLGYEQRFVLSFGAAGGSIKKLDQTYEKALDKYVAKSTLTSISSSVPTVDFWDWGSFVAISYNLGGVSLFSNVK